MDWNDVFVAMWWHLRVHYRPVITTRDGVEYEVFGMELRQYNEELFFDLGSDEWIESRYVERIEFRRR